MAQENPENLVVLPDTGNISKTKIVYCSEYLSVASCFGSPVRVSTIEFFFSFYCYRSLLFLLGFLYKLATYCVKCFFSKVRREIICFDSFNSKYSFVTQLLNQAEISNKSSSMDVCGLN